MDITRDVMHRRPEGLKAGWLFTLVLAVVTLIVTYYPPMSLFLVDLVFK